MSRKINKNFAALHKAITEQKYNDEGELVAGYRGAVLEGSSRSAKTWSSIDMICLLCARYEINAVINIVKETYNEFKTTLYNDFNKRLPQFGISSPFEDTKEVASFKIFGNRINLLGADKPSKFHGAQCDYLYINESLQVSQKIFDQAEMRCKKFWWMDFNPSVSEHYIFDKVVTRPDVLHVTSTFKDNPHISKQELNKILSYEPWLPNSYNVDNGIITYNDNEVSDNNQPPPHPTNISNGTADVFMWKVYGLGLRGAMTGTIFPNVSYIDEWPEGVAYTRGLDFGFTTDPTALVKYGQEGSNIYLELEGYEPTDDPDTLDEYMDSIGVSKKTPLTADSSDRYVSENKGAIEMVRALIARGYPCKKVSKTNSVMFWILSMKRYKIHIVKNKLYKFALKEQQNYKLKTVNGIAINQPEDKHNHFWDAARYAHMAYNTATSIWG